MSFDLTFPLWIKPWISGIYAFDCPVHGPEGSRTPAVLTAYLDEVDEATLVMHAPDFNRMDGRGEVEWCHWEAVRWRRGESVWIYRLPVFLDGDQDRIWNLRLDCEKPLSRHESARLRELSQSFDNTEDGSREVAEALLPFLPSLTELAIWDRREQLWTCGFEVEDPFDEDSWREPYILFVLDRPVIPLPDRVQ